MGLNSCFFLSAKLDRRTGSYHFVPAVSLRTIRTTTYCQYVLPEKPGTYHREDPLRTIRTTRYVLPERPIRSIEKSPYILAEQLHDEFLGELRDAAGHLLVTLHRSPERIGNVFTQDEPLSPAAQLVRRPDQRARSFRRIRMRRGRDVVQQPDELGQAERLVFRGTAVDNRARDVSELEAEHEVGVGQGHRAQSSRPVSREIHAGGARQLMDLPRRLETFVLECPGGPHLDG